MMVVGDAVESELVSKHTRPGGNVTGLSTLLPELIAKRLALLKEMVPQASRVAVFLDPANPSHRLVGWRAVEDAARALNISAFPIELSSWARPSPWP
jgi:putative ABC transport system substrate-binding protein